MAKPFILRTAGALVVVCLLASACRGGHDDQPSGTALGSIPLVRDCSLSLAHPVQTTFFVSPQGNDALDGTMDRPFQTMGRAQTAVRALAPTMTGDIIVSVHAGNYVLSTPLTFTDIDSGANGFQVVYTHADDIGSARFLGGNPLTNWTPYSGSIYQTDVPAGVPITTLYENGVRAEEARFPHRQNAASLPSSHSPYLSSANPAASSRVLTYTAGDLPALSGDLSGLKIFIWPGHDWFTDIVPVTLDTTAQRLTLAHDTRYPIVAGSRYFLEGALSLLGAPGEFFHNSASGVLYYWPRGRDIQNSEIVAPTLTTILSVQGSDPSRPVHDLRFDGLRFEASSFTTWYRFGWPQAGQSGESHVAPSFDRQIEMPANRVGLVTFENTERVDLMFSHIKDAGYGGVYMRFSNQQDCIYGNLIEHVGINGITVQGRYPGEGDVLHHNVLSNNLIRYVGEMAGNAAGVDLSNTSANEVSYSRIEQSPRFGVLWHADAAISGSLSYVHSNWARYLRLSDMAQDSGDTGALYAFGLSNDGNVRINTAEQIIVSNVVPDPSMRDIPPNGVFMDNGSVGQTLRNIRVGGTTAAPYRENPFGGGPQIFQNVSWASGFNNAALDELQIGLRADFPTDYLK